MRRLIAIGLIALAGCGEREPTYSAIICLEDRNNEHLIEKDFTQLFGQNGYEIDYQNYSIGMTASRFWGRRAYLNFEIAAHVKEAGEPTMITTHLDLDSDDPLFLQYKSLIEQKWGGFERPGRSYKGNECNRGASDTGGANKPTSHPR